MENASKALIIAGAILISILLIAISMYIYTSAKGTIDTAASKMGENEKQAYNATVLQYVGPGKRGNDALSVIDAVISSNNNCAGESGKFIAITPSGLKSNTSGVATATIGTPGDANNDAATVQGHSDSMTKLKGDINRGKKYDIDAKYSNTGIIQEIVITEKN